MSTHRSRQAHWAPLAAIAVLVVTVAACSGGGGAGGGGDDDDDGSSPIPTPARPGWVVARLQLELLSIAEADGNPGIVDITTAPTGVKSLVGFSAADEVVYKISTTATTSTGDLYAVNVDGTNDRLIAPGMLVHGWADGSHLIASKGPQYARDVYVVPVDGTGEIALSADATKDDQYEALSNGKVIVRRGTLGGNFDLYAIPALGGAAVQLTSETTEETFNGISASGRILYRTGTPPNYDVFSVTDAGTGKMTLASSVNDETVAGILGDRVFIQETVPTMDASEGNVYAVNADGTSFVALSSTVDVPENFVGVTAGGRALINVQTGFMPLAYQLTSVPAAGGTGAILVDSDAGGFDLLVGERVVYHRGSPSKLFAINADGTGLTTLVDTGVDPAPVGFGAGRILFTMAEAATPKLWSVPIAGGTPVKLRPEAGSDTFEGATYNFVVMSILDASNKTNLVAVDVDGNNPRVLAGHADNESWKAFTPDGRVIFTRTTSFLDDVFIISHDASTPEISLTNRADKDIYLGFLP